MGERASTWSVTINNPTPADDEGIAIAKQKGWHVEGQKEVGENGTPHYQLLVKTGQVRFSALKKAFPRGHIEVARNTEALKNYVNKEETRVGVLPTSHESFPTQLKLFDMFADWMEDKFPKGGYDDTSGDGWLKLFDEFVTDKILEGYIVENIAVNPQTRSALKSFGRAIIIRGITRNRQTDRQTPDSSVAPDNLSEDIIITNADSETMASGTSEEAVSENEVRRINEEADSGSDESNRP